MAILHGERSIESFRSKMTGGGARSNLFEVSIEYPAELGLDTDSNGAKAKGEIFDQSC